MTPPPEPAPRTLSRPVVVGVLVALIAIAVTEGARAVWSVGRHLTNEDNGLLWYASREWQHGRVHQPNFFGQGYGSTLEALPVTALHGVAALPYGTAMSLAFETLALGGWLLLALAAWRRRRPAMAVAAVGLPLALSGYYAVFVAIAPPSTAGRFLAMAAVALLIGRWRHLAVRAAAWSLAGLALQLDPSSALLVVPVVAWSLLTDRQWRRDLVAVAVGAVIPMAYFAWRALFYARHPDYRFYDALYGGASLRPHLSKLRRSMTGLGRLFGLYVPELVRAWWIPLVAMLVLIGLLLATRRVVYVVPAGTVALLFLYAVSTSKAGSDQGPLLPAGRVLLVLPATLWFLLFLVGESTAVGGRRWPSWSPGMAIALVCVVVVASSAVRTVAFGGREGSWRKRATELLLIGDYGYLPTGWVAARCHEDATDARAASVKLIVYPENYRLGYACAAVTSDHIVTLVPRYERRTWRMYAELSTRRTELLVVGVDRSFCDLARQRAACTWQATRAPLSAGNATLRFPLQRALPFIASLGLPIRPFGSRCHTQGNTCRPRGTRADLRRQRIGAPPVDVATARAAIARAFAGMFADGTLPHSLPNVELGEQELASVAPRLQSRPDVTRQIPRLLGVTFLDAHEATVDVEVGGRTIRGEAVIEGSTWKVAAPTFCAVLSLWKISCPLPGQ